MLYYVVIAMEQYFIFVRVKKVLHKIRYGGTTSTTTAQWLAAWNGSTSKCENIDQSILDDPMCIVL